MQKVKVILGSTREGRQGEQVAAWVMHQLEKGNLFDAELLDLREYPLPYYSDPIPAGMLKAPYNPPIRDTWGKKISEADAILVVTPEYNHGYPAVLKSAFDSIYKEWNNKPIAFVSYGGAANGARAVEQLRQVVIELQMAPIREGLHIGIFTGQKVFGGNGEMLIESNNRKLEKLFHQLLWWSEALHQARLKE